MCLSEYLLNNYVHTHKLLSLLALVREASICSGQSDFRADHSMRKSDTWVLSYNGTSRHHQTSKAQRAAERKARL